MNIHYCFLFSVMLMALQARGQTLSGLPDAASGLKVHFTDNHLSTTKKYFNDTVSSETNYSNPALLQAMVARFKLPQMNARGFANKRKAVYLNGIEWNFPEDNSIPFNDLSPLFGIADVENTQGLMFPSTTFGGLNGISCFNINPLNKQKSSIAAYGLSNDNLRNSIQVQYLSGRLQGEWAAGFQLLQKWTREGATPGTSLQRSAFVASIGKSFSKDHTISLVILAHSATENGTSSITRETALLSGNYQYNPDWGYQMGAVRNAGTEQHFLPAAILSYRQPLGSYTKLDAALSFQSGSEATSCLDWFHAYNPLPDYYKNLPSFYYHRGGSYNHQTGNILAEQWQEQALQIDWNHLYEANRANRISTITGASRPSLYVLAKDFSRQKIFRAATQVQHAFSKNLQIWGGLQYAFLKNHYYRELTDLLGGNYFVNLNQFALRSFGQQPGWEQFDLRTPNRNVLPGEKYRYDYLAQSHKGKLWFRASWQQQAFHFCLGSTASLTSYQRTGFYQNGVFPDDSYGPSGQKSFLSWQTKAELDYRFNEAHVIGMTALYGTEAPEFQSVFFNPSIRNATIKGIKPESLSAIEIHWEIHRKKWQASLSAFSSEIKNQASVTEFYHDDFRTFVHLILTGINTARTGLEFASAYTPCANLDINFAALWMQGFYRSRPSIKLIRDNDTSPIAGQETVYWKNYSAVSGPQTVLGMGINLHHPHLGYLAFSGSWQGRNYVSLNPLRYTEKAVYLLQEEDAQRAAILGQEKLKDYFLLNIEAGRQFRLLGSNSKFLRKSAWYLSAGIQNLLNYKGYALYGSEQLRFDFDQKNPEIFPNKYKFGFGRTYFVRLRYQGW